MSSGITFSGFNDIDFNVILNSVMAQESLPLQLLQSRQSQLSSLSSAYATLATRLAGIDSAASGLSTLDGVRSRTATVSDSSILSASAQSTATAGRYEVVVDKLARSQVTASTSVSPDADTTVIATGGTLTIGGVDVVVTAPTTLQGLANQINATAGSKASAGVIEVSPGQFKIVLTGTETGAASGFAMTSSLTGGPGVAFGANAVDADDASVRINNIQISSASNTLTAGIPGVTLQLAAKDPAKTVVVTVAADNDAIIGKVQSFVTAYNELVAFTNSQNSMAAGGQSGTLARDAVLRSLRTSFRSALGASYGTGAVTQLAAAGIGFDQSGKLTLDKKVLTDALAKSPADVQSLFSGSGAQPGAFGAISKLVKQYTDAGGFVPAARTQLERQNARMKAQVADMEARLAVRRAALQKEYTAADQAMSSLKAQSGSLSSIGSGGLFK